VVVFPLDVLKATEERRDEDTERSSGCSASLRHVNTRLGPTHRAQSDSQLNEGAALWMRDMAPRPHDDAPPPEKEKTATWSPFEEIQQRDPTGEIKLERSN